MHKKILLQCLICLMIIIYGCENSFNHKITRGIYYWRTNFTLTGDETRWIRENNIKKMYVRFFDVDWNSNVNQAVPVGEISIESKAPEGTEIIPAVFITNRTFINIDDSLVDGLAENIFKKISYRFKDFDKKPLNEFQTDCDWTSGTKEKYFHLINRLNELAVAKNISVTATIRLHQVKYFEKTGIPPVTRGMLMFYNMSDVSNIRTRNSIYDEDIAKRYLVNFDKYPIPLDVVLPAFSWGVLFRNEKIKQLINDIAEEELSENDKYESLGSGYYRAEENNYLHGFFITENNIIRLEEITPADTRTASEQVSHYLKDDSTVISLYHLNKGTAHKYGKDVWEDITSFFD